MMKIFIIILASFTISCNGPAFLQQLSSDASGELEALEDGGVVSSVTASETDSQTIELTSKNLL